MSAEIPPLPTDQQYFDAAVAFRSSIDQIGVKAYFGRALSVYATPNEKRIAKIAKTIGATIEPIDRSTGKYVDPSTQTAIAVSEGALAGFAVAKKAHTLVLETPMLDKQLMAAGLEMGKAAEEIDDDEFGKLNELANRLVEYGEKGLVLINQETQDVLEEIEMKAVADVTKQSMFRIGAGVLLKVARDVHIEALAAQEASKITDVLSGSFNWDSAFEAFFNEEGKAS